MTAAIWTSTALPTVQHAILPSVFPALLYVGDGHALQGNGELNGNALETSMNVELSVDRSARKRTYLLHQKCARTQINTHGLCHIAPHLTALNV